MANTFNFLEVKFRELTDNIKDYVRSLYNKSDINLTSASPYSHIIEAITKINEGAMMYLKNTLMYFDVNNKDNKNPKIIRAWARIAGYNPSRNLSSTGTLMLKLKPSESPSSAGRSQIVIPKNTHIECLVNSLTYYIDFTSDFTTFTLEKNKPIYLPITQGKVHTQTFTGTGGQEQSYTVVLPDGQTAEQFRVSVKVNGEYWARKEHFFDMFSGEKAWYMRTGIDGAVDIYFGTDDFGSMPPRASEIAVTYTVSNGAQGNIPSVEPNIFTFTDEVYDGFGEVVDMESLFDIFIDGEVSLGADMESTEFTKKVIPYASRNFVLARPEHFIFLLKRLNQFSQIDAFTTEKGTELDNNDPEDDSVVYIMLVPDIMLYLQGGVSYFNIDTSAFYLDDREKDKIKNYIKTQGIISTGVTMKILDPKIKKYAVNIYLRLFEDAVEDNVRSVILTQLSDFFSSMERRGRIDKSGVIKIIEEIDGVDSVMVEFVSEDNELYHLDFEKYKESLTAENPDEDPDKIEKEGYEPSRVIGLDPDLGDIVYNKDEIPIIRGGWFTRNNIFIKETPEDRGYTPVNITVKGRSKRKLF